MAGSTESAEGKDKVKILKFDNGSESTYEGIEGDQQIPPLSERKSFIQKEERIPFETKITISESAEDLFFR